MQLPYSPSQVGALSRPAEATEVRLTGWRLALARAVWLTIVALALGLFVAGVVVEIAHIRAACPTPACARSNVSAAMRQAFRGASVSMEFFDIYATILECSSAIVYTMIGVVIFVRRSDDQMALFVSFTLVLFSVSSGASGFTSFLHVVAIAYPIWTVPVAALSFLGSECFDLFLFLFPTRRFIPRWTLWVAVGWTLLEAFRNFTPGAPTDSGTWPIMLQLAIWSIFIGTIIAAQVYHYRRVSTPRQRRQTRWVVFGVVSALTIFLSCEITLVLFAPDLTAPHSIDVSIVVAGILAPALTLIPLSIGVALLRDHLFDVDVIISRALLYGALTVCVVGLYALVVGGFSVVFQTRVNIVISLVATGVVAVAFQPLRERLQRGANRLVYGRRDEPYAVLSELGRRLEVTLASDDILPAIVESVTQALKLPYAAIALTPDTPRGAQAADPDAEVIAAASGAPTEQTLRLPLVYSHEQVGVLLLAPRAPGDAFTSADLSLLRDLARQVGVAAHAVRLNADLRRLNADLLRSRAQLLTTREEERRRMRRDLHDGLGSALTSVTYKLAAAQNLLARDPVAVERLLGELKTQTQDALADIRRLVYDLRPPALDELGLLSALHEQIGQYQLDGVRVAISAPDALPPLPAVVELAAYRITLAALANVIRHAHAQVCDIRLNVVAEALTLDIQDDGVGLPAHYHPGVGVTAMYERAAELGGVCTIETIPTSGTRIHARLPLITDEGAA